MTLADALTAKLREMLRDQGWSQEQFAKKLGVTQGCLSSMLHHRRRKSTLDFYEHLAAMCGLSLSGLIRELEHRQRGHVRIPAD